MQDVHQFSSLLAFWAGNSPVTGEFPSQRPVTRNFDVFFDLHLNKRLSKQSSHRWFEMPSHPLWCHCNDILIFQGGSASNDPLPSTTALFLDRLIGGKFWTLWMFNLVVMNSFWETWNFPIISSNLGGTASWNPSSWKTRTCLYRQYHGCWCPSDARSLGISSHGIDLDIQEYFSFSTKVNEWFDCYLQVINMVKVSHFEGRIPSGDHTHIRQSSDPVGEWYSRQTWE